MKKFKKILIAVLAGLMLFSYVGCSNQSNTKDNKEAQTKVKTTSENYDIKPLVGEGKDYSNKDNWMVYDSDKKQSVDLFYLYPTSASATCTTVISEVDDAMKNAAMKNYLKSGEALSSYCNVYAPYYRQVTAAGIMTVGDADGLMNLCIDNETRTDVYAALDYFFQNINEGRPYILAGHSQGSCNIKIILSEYMKVHPEYLERMVACYPIGYYFPDSWFAENPQVKKAQGETDTGVLISWNTEAEGAEKFNLPVGSGSFAINPLNWKTDETPAGIELNKGSVDVDDNLQQTFVQGKADATIDLKRGAIVCKTSQEYIPDNPIFGDKSFHFDDWALYYQNIKENAQKRITAFLAK